MSLAMSRPFKHPRTGIYWLRRRVPKDLVAIVGRREVTKSLGTRDPAEAKQKLVQALAELDAQWANQRRGPRLITDREAHALAVTMYNACLAKHRDNPSEQVMWRTGLHDRLWTVSPNGADHWTKPLEDHSEEAGERAFRAITDDTLLSIMRKFCYQQAEGILVQSGFSTDGLSLMKMAMATAEAMQRAALILEREARGIYEPGTEPFAPDELGALPQNDPSAAVLAAPNALRLSMVTSATSLRNLVEAWWREAQATGRKASTYDSYSNTFANFGRFLGHDDAGRVTADDVIRFKDYRLTTPSAKTGRVASAKTVKGTDLTALKTVFGWGVSNRRLIDNPAASVTMKVGKQPRLRSKGFSDAEATAILRAATAHSSDRENQQTSAGKRWVPWLCALTGARVGEMGQLRKQDLRRWQDQWVIRITPEAGTVKTNEARDVVLHPQLVKLGFPAFVQDAPEGPLFVRAGKDGDVLGPLQALKNRLAEFARAIVSDRNVAPMHGFRHRFKTVGMEVGVAPRILDAIQGQAARSVADTYGDVTLITIAAAIAKFPAIKVGKSE